MEGARVFVKIDDSKDIGDIIGLIRDKLEESKAILERLEELKDIEDSESDLWASTLEKIKDRVDYTDQALFQENL